MLSADQEKWIAHLSSEKIVKIEPYDERSDEIFEKVRLRITEVIGDEFSIEQRGSTKLRIPGQDEIDLYIPVAVEMFDELISSLSGAFGEPRSNYPQERVRFAVEQDGKRVDTFLINKDSAGWLNGLIFEEYLMSHPDALEEYVELKGRCNGMNMQEFYRQKNEFINDILIRATAAE